MHRVTCSLDFVQLSRESCFSPPPAAAALSSCRFLDSGLDELGPKGADFLTVLAAHEGEGMVIDRSAGGGQCHMQPRRQASMLEGN